MLVRLLLALLLAGFAVPAAAAEPACHGGAMAMHHDTPTRHDPAPPPHACIGCVPLADWLAERLPAPVVLAAQPPQPRDARLDPGSAAPPALPPPRRG